MSASNSRNGPWAALLPRAPWSRLIPPPLQLVAVATGVLAVWMRVTGLDGERGGDTLGGGALGPGDIALVGDIPTGLRWPPKWPLPANGGPQLVNLLATAGSVALVGFVESASVAQSFALKHGYDVSPSSELKAVGIVNVVGACSAASPSWRRSGAPPSATTRAPRRR